MQAVTSDPKQIDQDSKCKRIVKKIASLFQRHRKKKIAALILILGAVFIMQTLSNREPVILVSIGEVEKSSFEQNVFASGKLEVKDKQEFYAESKTTIKEITVKAGEKVKKGQVVLRTDDSGLAVEASKNRLACEEIKAKIINSESSIRLLQEDYHAAQKDYDTAQILFSSGAISSNELEDVEKKLHEAKEKLLVEQDANLSLLKSQLVQAEAVYNESKEKLEKATVVSPIDGVLLNLPVKEGQEVETGTLLAQIGNPDELQIETGINEIDAAQLKVGDKVEISSNALLDEPLSGSIDDISPIAEVVTTSQGEQTQVKIKVSVDKSEEMAVLKPGYNVNLKVIIHEKEEALLVPFEAVVENGEKDLVFVVGVDGIVSQREVKTGLSNELFVEIISGLNEGEKVVLSPGEEIKDGVKVIIDAQGK
ncbi:MAG: efflux RND transporter periplasmic adaptor subunit [Bacillota bacterium]|jgi:HlyD family secretion protein